MAKKIKKHIERSMPIFMIISLIVSTTAIGLIFNFEFSLFGNNSHDISISIGPADVNADTASTSVQVRNAPPTFSVEAAESPASTSTSPTNVGGSATFTAQANDSENNDYYLIVCDTAAVTASTTGGAPTCDSVTFCVSTSTLITNEASCTYSNVADPGAETEDWYAYVCDNHSTEGACSDAYSQGDDPGNGDDSSPLHINHNPFFYTAWTSDNNKDPGGTFTVTASSTDSDVLGTADEIIVTVCSSNSWTSTGGCVATQWCKGTSTSPNVSCSFATTTPAMDGNWDYYAFVMDGHYLAATTSYSAVYTVNNVAPSISGVTIHGGVNIQLNIKGAAAVLATTSATISDNNGCQDVVSATGTLYHSFLGENAYACTADDDDCYVITSVNCAYEANSCDPGGASPTQTTYTCSTTIAFNANPTDGVGGNYPWAGTSWLGSLKAFDEALSGVGTSSSGVALASNEALDIQEDEIVFGSIRGAENSGADNGTTTVENYGNTPINTQIIGEDMVRRLGGDWIAASQQRFATSTFTYPGTGVTTQLSSTSAATYDVDVNKPINTQTLQTDEVYWGIAIPALKQSGWYDGVNTFTVVLDNNDW